MGRKLALASALAGAALAFVLPSAAAAATTLGETFAPGGCAEDTYIQSDTPSGAPSYTAPFDGVITRWSYQSDASPPPSVRLKVARDLGGGSFKIVAQSALEDITANTLNTYQSRISMPAGTDLGEYIGDDCSRGDADYTDHFAATDLPVGTTTDFTQEHFQQDISAVLEPDVDHDGYGDETQDQCPSNGATAGPCPPGSTILGAMPAPAGSAPGACMGAVIAETESDSSTPYTVPSAGTITAWAATGLAEPGIPLTLVVLRSAGGLNYTVVGTDTHTVPTPVPDPLSFTVGSPISVSGGEILALFAPNGANFACYFKEGTTPLTDGLIALETPSTPTAGQALAQHDASGGGFRLNLAATLTPSAPTPATGQPGKKKCKKKKHKKHAADAKKKKCKKKKRK